MLQKSLFWAPFFMQPPSRLSATPWECGSAPGSPALMAQCRWHGAGGMVPGHGCPTGRPHPGQLPGAWAWGSAPRELGLGRDRRSWQTFGENRLPPSRVPSKGEQAPRTPGLLSLLPSLSLLFAGLDISVSFLSFVTQTDTFVSWGCEILRLLAG